MENRIEEHKEINKQIVQGSVSVVSAQMLVRVFSVLFSIFVARKLTATAFGDYSFILSFTGMLYIVSDFGLNIYLIYILARDKRDLYIYANNVLSIKIVLIILMVGINCVLAKILGRSSNVIAGIFIISLSFAISAITLFFRTMFQATGKMGYEALLSSLDTLTRVFVGAFFLIRGYSFLLFLSSYLVSAVFLLIVTIKLYSKKFELGKLHFDLSYWKLITKETLPFCAALVLISIYGQVDVVLLGVLGNSVLVAWYSAGLSLATAWVFIVSALVIAIFPSLCSLYEISKTRLLSLCRKAFKITFAIGMFISLELMVFSKEFVQLIYGSKFEQSGTILAILSWMGFLMAINMLLGAYVRAIKQQQVNGYVSGIALVFSVGINFLLIPVLGGKGVAIAVLCTQALVFVSYTITIWKSIGAFWTLPDLLKPLFGVAVIIIMNLLLQKLYWILVIGICFLLYLVMLYLIKFISKEDSKIIFSSLRLGKLHIR